MMAALSHIGPNRIPQWIDACLMVELGCHGIAAGYLRDAGDPDPYRAIMRLQARHQARIGNHFEATCLELASEGKHP